MKKESKEMLKEILSNQQLIMKALKISVPEKKVEKKIENKASKPTFVKTAVAKKVVAKKAVKKVNR